MPRQVEPAKAGARSSADPLVDRPKRAQLPFAGSLARTLGRPILASICSTWRENTYCAGRWPVREISGAIGPSVRTPRKAIHSDLNGLAKLASAAVGS